MRIARFRTSLTIRVTAAWLSGLLLGGTGALARAGVPPRADARSTSRSAATSARPVAASEPPTPATEAERVWTVPVMPKRLSWVTPSAADPWMLFDGDPAATPEQANHGQWTLAVTLDAPTALSALTVHGPARGTLSAFAKDARGLRPIAGWTDRKVVVNGGQWVRVDGGEKFVSAEVVLRWTSEDQSAPGEIGLWANKAAGASFTDDELADQLLSANPVDAMTLQSAPSEARVLTTAPGPVVFRAHFDRDPRVVGRAFLVYELANLGHWTQVERQINGLSRHGGRIANASGKALRQGGLQVEEISPSWLKAGDNEIRFFPSAATQYSVRNVRIVAVPHDRIATMHVEAADSTARAVFAQASQIHEVMFDLTRPADGNLVVTASKHQSVAIPLAGLEPGWHRHTLDRFPTSLAATVSYQPKKKPRRNAPLEDASVIANVAFAASSSADAGPVAVTYPLHGDCFDGQANVRGFLRTAANEEVVSLAANGQAIPVTADSSFELSTPVAAKAERGWDLPLEAKLASGKLVARRVHIDACLAHPSAADGLAEDDGAPFGTVVRPGEGRTIHFAGATLEIPKGAVDHDVRITVRPLVAAQVAPMSGGITNVSPNGHAFRFGPHGLKFKKPITITLPYDRRAMQPGTQERQIFGFYYDEPQQKWVRIGRYGVAENGALASLSEHFTDFVNATIAMPDQPGTKSFSTTEMSGIKLADPSAGIDLIAPPVANSAGDARLQYPIEVPPGRNGIQPNLAFTYSSAHGNGWVGTGWDLDLPAIEIDTRFGAPDYFGPHFLTEATYLLNGESIVPANDGDDDSYRRRVEGRFDRIHRERTAGCVTSFQVTDKNGTVYTYGGPGATVSDPDSNCHAFRWNLSTVRDTFGNVMQFTYTPDPLMRDSSPNGDRFTWLYPAQIDYTSNDNHLPASYHVVFAVDPAIRPDVVINGRAGFQTRIQHRLHHVDVAFQSTVIRRYQLNYLDDSIAHFHKSLLSSITVLGLNAAKQLDQHTFDYFAADWDGTSVNAWGPMQTWGGADPDDRLSHSSDESGGAGASIGVGVGPFSFTVSAEGMGGTTDLTRTMPDINGDGLPDIVSNGDSFLNLLKVPSTTQHLQPIQVDLWGLTPNHTNMAGVNVRGELDIYGSASLGYSQTWQTDDRILMDVDGDGLVDLVTIDRGNVWWRKNLGYSGGGTVHYSDSRLVSNQILASTVIADGANRQAAADAGGFDRVDPLTRWIAPFDGMVTFAGAVGKLKDGGTGVIASVYRCHGQDKCASPELLWQRTFGAANFTCVPTGNSDCGSGLRMFVSRGDRLFTMLTPVHDPATTIAQLQQETLANDVAWDPTVTYDASASDAVLLEPYGAPIYTFEQNNDFKVSGHPPAQWVAHSKGTVRITGNFTKYSTSDDVTLWVLKATQDQDACSDQQKIVHKTYAGSSSTSEAVGTTLQVDAGDRLTFEVIPGTEYQNSSIPFYPGTPIDPSRAKWMPTVTYIDMCRTDSNGQDICGPVSCGATTCGILGDDPDAKYPKAGITWNPTVYQENTPLVQKTATVPYVVPSDGTLTLSGGFAASVNDVDVLIQGVNKLYYKQRLHNVADVATIDNLSIDAKQGDELFVTLYSASGQDFGYLGGVKANGVQLPVNVRSRDLSFGDELHCRQTDDPMSGGYHSWYYGFYDGEFAFDERQIAFPFDADGKLKNAYRLAVASTQSFDQLPAVPVWAGPGGAYIAANREMTTRTASGGGSPSGDTPGVADSLRHASTWNFDFNASATVISTGWNHGQTNSDHDFFDFNGDHYPDHVSLDGTISYLRFADPGKPDNASFDTRSIPGFSTDGTCSTLTSKGCVPALRRVEHGTVTIGSGTPEPIYNNPDTGGSGATASIGFSEAARYGASNTSVEWFDVNGDGLPDLVRRATSTGQNNENDFIVKLNYGYKLGDDMVVPAVNWDTQALPFQGTIEGLLSGAMTSGYLNFPTGDIGLNGVRMQDSGTFTGTLSASGGGSSGGTSFGGGVSAGFSYTAHRTLIDLVDVNGDGLPDQVMKVPDGSGTLRVRLNRGADFEPTETRWVLPEWGHIDNNGEDGLFEQLGAIGDGISYDRTKSFDFGLNIKVCWILCVGVEAFYSNANTWSDMKLQDMNGDGLPDMVLKRPGDGRVLVKLNQLNGIDGGPATPVNLLKAVHRPLGSTIKLTYARAGNTVIPEQQPAIDMPTNKYVMTSVDVDDNFGNSYKRTISYGDHGYQNGFYDRLEREDYGFLNLTTTREDQSTVTESFINTNFYQKGLPSGSITSDSQSYVFTSDQVFYAAPDATALGTVRYGSFFPSKSRETTNWVEGTTTTVTAAPKSRTTVYQKYDDYGNLTDFQDYGDDGTDDDVFYHVNYASDLGQHIFKATEVKANATAPDGPLLRDRLATYDSHGALQTLTNVLQGGKDPTTGTPYTGQTNPTWTLVRDAYGNIIQEIDPRQYSLTYTFDDATQTYRTATSDSFGYRSSSIPNYFFGAVATTTDVNGNMELYTYDDFGRLSTVYGPNDPPGDLGTDFCAPNAPSTNEPTIAFCYSRAGIPAGSTIPTEGASQPAYAITRHKDVRHPGDPVVTSTFVDGLDRVIQTKKDLERDTGAGTQVGMTVSGVVAFDPRGRIASQDQPVFDPSGDPTAYYQPPAQPGRLTQFAYDILDRKTSITTPDGAVTTMSYGLEMFDNVLRLSTAVKDANVNAGGGLPGFEHKTFSDVRGLTLGVQQQNRIKNSTAPTTLLTRYQYDAIGELTTVTDAKANVTHADYDTLGRMVALDSPDAGRTEWRYDLSGNLGAKETARLRKQSQLILYDHEFNRLRTIVYPTSPAVTYLYGGPAEAGGIANLASRIKSETSEAGRRDYQYDALGNVTQEHWLLHPIKASKSDYEHTTGYTHDSFGRLLSVIFGDDANEVVTYNYDHGGSVTNVVGVNMNPNAPGSTTYVSQIGYDEFGQRTRLVYGNGIVATYQYDPLTRRLTNINADERDPKLVQQNQPARPFQRLFYGYDLVGNVTQIRNDAPYVDKLSGPVLIGTVAQNFTYDDLYQLKTAAGTYQEQSASQLNYGLGFSYDEIGNIVTKTQTNDLVSGNKTQADTATTYSSAYTYGGPRPHAPTEVDETLSDKKIYPRVISYDDDGNQSGWLYNSNSRRQTTWDEEDRIQSVQTNGVLVAQALYDGGGDRAVNFQQPVDGSPAQETAYFGANVTLRGGSHTTKHVFVGDVRIASKMESSSIRTTPTTVYFHDDHLGSTNFLTDDSQELIAHEEYFPTGELWVDESDRRFLDRQAYLFSGKELDSGTGLYYYGARYYDPHLSQWNSVDPILNEYMAGAPSGGVFLPANLGLYSYTANNPVTLRDPNGRALNLAAAAAGFIGGALCGTAYWAYKAWHDPSQRTFRAWGGKAVGWGVTGGMVGLTMGGSLAAQLTAGGLAAGEGYLVDNAISGTPSTYGGLASASSNGVLFTMGGMVAGRLLGLAFNWLRGAPQQVPLGFSSPQAFAQFGAKLRTGLARAGFGDAEALFQGSSVTGQSYRTGEPFDVGRTSDFDIALSGSSILSRAKALGIGLRSGGTRTGPLTAAEVQKMGLGALQSELSTAAGRPVNFMIYGDAGAAAGRSPSIPVKR